MNAVVRPIFSPDVEAMRAHVEHLFGGYLDGCHEGLIELAWTDSVSDESGRYRLKNARLFGTDKIEDLVQEAARLNATPMCNVYIGAALRHPNTAPFGRTNDKDAWALTCAYVDLDDPGTATSAKNVYGEDKPTMVIVTGREPHPRAQMWWRLEEPLTDKDQWPILLKGFAAKLSGDTTVTNPARVMRLAGTIAWPVKPGRTIELTSIAKLNKPGRNSYSADYLARSFPYAEPIKASPVKVEVERKHSLLSALAVKRGEFFRKVNDIALQDTGAWVPAIFGTDAQLQRGTGAWRISSKALGRDLEEDLSISPNGIVDFGVADLGDSRQGKRSAIDIVIEYGGAPGAKEASLYLCGLLSVNPSDLGWEDHSAKPFAQANNVELTAPLGKTKKIQTTDFMTLYTEEVVEEPDYIEPNFAGPGNFVLIAGPPKAQKSFLLQEMLVAAATGGSFLANTFTCPKPVRIFYLQAEMNRKLLRKRARELKMLSSEEKQLLRQNLIISERFHMILNDGGVKTAVETIKESFPVDPPDIIAVDPLANVFDQENESDNAQMMRFLTTRIESVRQEINPDACVVMVHHATKKSSEEMAKDPFVAIRGAGALRGYYDSAIVIFRTSEESKSRKLHFELRSGESPEPLTLELIGGRFKNVTETSSITKDAARLILKEINAAWLRNAPWSPHERSKVEGRYAAHNASTQFNVPEKAAKFLIEEWQRNGVIAFRDRVQGKRPSGLQVIGSID